MPIRSKTWGNNQPMKELEFGEFICSICTANALSKDEIIKIGTSKYSGNNSQSD